MSQQSINELALRLRLSISRTSAPVDVMNALLDQGERDNEFYLDLLDAALDVWAHLKPGDGLEPILQFGGSIWRVSNEGTSLVQRVSNETQKAFDAAVAPADAASMELAEAWTRAFGRSPNPSDAWDHAIKAVEAVLCPTVEPSNTKSTLGSTLAVLSQPSSTWHGLLPGKNIDHPIDLVVETLRQLWPNPDRHATGNGRPPTLAEGQAAVLLAMTIVQWHRIAYIVKK